MSGNIFYYGASKCMISPYVNGAYQTPWEEETIKQLGIEAASSNQNKFYGSNRVIFKDNGSGGKKLSLQMSAFSDRYRTDILGQTKVGGIVIEGPDDIPADFALGVQLEGDAGGMRIWFLMCQSGVPTFTPQTNTDAPSEVSMSASVEASPCEYTLNGTTYKGTVITCQKGEPGYNTFLDAVPSNVTVPDCTLSALAISGVTLSPTFAANKQVYTGSASGSSGTITATATAASSAATVAIKANGTTVQSGGAVDWNTGTNIVTVDVTNDGVTQRYTVTVTKS